MTTTVDWSVLDIPDVVAICEQEAIKVSRQFAGVMEYDDLRQEALIAVSMFSGKVRAYIQNGEKGYLAKWVWGRLVNIANREARYTNNTVPLDFVPA